MHIAELKFILSFHILFKKYILKCFGVHSRQRWTTTDKTPLVILLMHEKSEFCYCKYVGTQDDWNLLVFVFRIIS